MKDSERKSLLQLNEQISVIDSQEQLLTVAEEFCSRMNSAGSVVRVSIQEGSATYKGFEGNGWFSVTFEAKVPLNDPYIRPLDRGESHTIGLSDKFYAEAKQLSLELFGTEPKYNNTGTIFWMSKLVKE